MEEKKFKKFSPYLQEVLSSKVSLKIEEQKMYNNQFLNVLKRNLIPKMKEVDPVFKELYRKEMYTGSYYENLRVGSPDEFDLNFILKLPAEITLQHCEPGFLKIKTTKWEHKDVLQRIKWRDTDGYILHDNVLQWFQGVVDLALNKLQIPGCKINRSMHGPAVTLSVNSHQQRFSVDLVPVFVFGKDKWPKPPIRPPPTNYNLEDWCVVPKAPHDKPGDKRIWRISFYPQEKDILNNTCNMKAVLKLIKLLRDKEGWHSLVSYHIKTVFMWAISEDPSLATKDLGIILMHMLEKLKGHMKAHKIPFYWDKRYNLISNMNRNTSENIGYRIGTLQKMIQKHIDENPQLVKWLFMPRHIESESQIQNQQPGNSLSLIEGLGALAIGGALFLGAIGRHQNNN